MNKDEFQSYVKSKYNNLLSEQKIFFENVHDSMTIDNHAEHFYNPDYWNILLKEIKDDPDRWEDKLALDFGCGCGRNIKTLLELANWQRVDGVDISRKNVEYTKKYVNNIFPNKCGAWDCDGCTISSKKNVYDFIMSTITLQHISSHEIRKSILMDVFDLLKPGGLVSVQFADMYEGVCYYHNNDVFEQLTMNCRVDDIEFIRKDFEEIGFEVLDLRLNTEVFHCPWYFIKATKNK